MARDLGLEEAVREYLPDDPGLFEKAMFGGWAWLLDGKLLCGAREDGVLVRLGRGHDSWALELDGVRPMISRGKVMAGWVSVTGQAFCEGELGYRLMAQATGFVRSLPCR